MSFKNLIDNLTCEEKNNFDYYSQIRGVQQYKIIYETLEKIAPGEITYKDVNSFVRYDKAIKDVLYKYLGTLEEYIKTYIFANYDFKKEAKLTKKEYIFFNQLQALIEKKTVSLDEVSELYKRYRLNFKDMVDLLKEFEPNGKFVPDELYLIKDLRNNVMHHSPLLFNINGAEKVNETKKLITLLIKHLPLDYPKYIAEDINDKTKHIKNNINEKLYCVLLCEFLRIFMCDYVSKKNLSYPKKVFINWINKVQKEVKSNYGLTFSFLPIGSGSRNMVIKKCNENYFDLDYQIVLQKKGNLDINNCKK